MSMTDRGSVRRSADPERGQVLVLVALLIPVLFAIAAIVLDVGNWYVHKRHIQTQVDAAVLAPVPQFVGCFHDPAAANAAVASRALAYAGDTLRLGKLGPGAPDSTTNLQVQEPNDVRIALNSSRYWQQSDGMVPGANGYGLDNSIAIPGDPCSTRSLDAKATDDEAPPLWGLIPLTPSPKTHAKVEIFDLESSTGMLPWAVPEIDPHAVVALFVNEDDGTVFDSQLLIAFDTALPWSEWVTPLGQEDVTLDGTHDNTGVVILISKNDPTPVMTGTLAGICGQDPGLVTCYANDGGSPPLATPTSGLSFIHGYNGGGSGTLRNPIIRQVELVANGCSPADLSAAYFTLDGGASCNANMRAVIDFGVGAANPELFPRCVTVTASPGGTLTWTGDVVEGSVFEGSFNLASGSGRNGVDLDWVSEDRPGPPNNCNQTRWNGAFNKVAAPYVADQYSGPVQYLDLNAFNADGVTPVPDPNSVEKNDPGNLFYKYFVTVGLPKPHSVVNYTDPPLLLRFASPGGSQNQTFDCDSGVNLTDEIVNGCQTAYIENYRDLSTPPDGTKEWNNILCAGYGPGNLPPPTFNPIPREDCVITQTGAVVAQRAGLHERFETPCYYNNWPDDAAEASIFFGPNGGGYGTDPRYVTLIITDETAFQASGNDPLPLKYFAGFYVTGWDYHPIQSPGCPDPDGPGGLLKGNDCHPLYGCNPSPHSLDDGDVWGYFVDIVLFSGSGDPSDDLCTFGGDPAACVAQLVE